jgi:TonB family protein
MLLISNALLILARNTQDDSDETRAAQGQVPGLKKPSLNFWRYNSPSGSTNRRLRRVAMTSKLASTLCGFALLIVAVPVIAQQSQTPPSARQRTTPQNHEPSAQPAPQTRPNDEKVRVYISDSESWEILGGWGTANHQNASGSGDVRGRPNPRTAEIINFINQSCPELMVTGNRDQANYAVNDAGEDSCGRKQITVSDRDSDSIFFFEARKGELGKSVKNACAAILNYAGHGKDSPAPVEGTVSLGWASPKECPGQVYDRGEVEASGRLLSKDGKVVGISDSDDYAVPHYPMQDIKDGASGKIVLSVALDGAGRVKEIHVVKSLSPHLDEAALKAVRTWKFKLIGGNPGDPPNDFQVP